MKMWYGHYIIALLSCISPPVVCSILPVTCPTPAAPQHSCKDGSLYHHPNNITYSCFPGYRRSGARVITCQLNGQWTAEPPTCMPCPMHTYNEERDGTCTRCPRYTFTVTMATTSRLQCLCNPGYHGLPGGPCAEIRCPLLEAPANGRTETCDNKQGSTCVFDCNSGYVMGSGSRMRTCQGSTEWDGNQPICTACPINTYKMGRMSCVACPLNSHTTGIPSAKEGCICNVGFTGQAGGPYTDMNECLVNNGKGPCDEKCFNTIGSYRCGCVTPGYIIDRQNPDKCIVNRQCTNLTQADAPENGGLVCHWIRAENRQLCARKCNRGYEFPRRVGLESCGPQTGYVWSFRVNNPTARLDSCIEQSFPEYRAEAMSSYFVSACHNLSYSELVEVKANFTSILNQQGRIGQGVTHNAADVNVICGNRNLRRRKRGVEDMLKSIHEERFEIDAIKVAYKPKDCGRICKFLHIPAQNCDQYCLIMYKKYLRSAVSYAKRKRERIYRRRPESVIFTAANRTFEQIENALTVNEFKIRCPNGMEAHGDKCVCPEGKWGSQCNATCDCRHGHCDPENGSCICQSGWQGTNCNTDIPGCDDNDCYPNVTCTDVPAPGIGYKCGACPVGFTGDGSACLPMDI